MVHRTLQRSDDDERRSKRLLGERRPRATEHRLRPAQIGREEQECDESNGPAAGRSGEMAAEDGDRTDGGAMALALLRSVGEWLRPTLLVRVEIGRVC